MSRVFDLAEDCITILRAIQESIATPENPPIPSPTLTPWEAFIAALKTTTSIPASIKSAVLAQAIVETGRGKSALAVEHFNFHGMKWRVEMGDIGAASVEVPVTSEASGKALFCAFRTPADAVAGYWRFLQRAPYVGYDKHTISAVAFLRFVCPIWAADPKYSEKCLSVLVEAEDLLDLPPQPRPEVAMHRPDSVKESPNQSERGATITHIILHNTAGSYGGAVEWLCNRESKVSAHIVISRKAHVTQLVQFDKKAWHAGNARMNANSIGIEIEATVSQRGMTPEQEKKVLGWVRQLMAMHDIPIENVGIHRWFSATTCPGLIWETDEDFRAWRKKHLGS